MKRGAAFISTEDIRSFTAGEWFVVPAGTLFVYVGSGRSIDTYLVPHRGLVDVSSYFRYRTPEEMSILGEGSVFYRPGCMRPVSPGEETSP